MASAGPARVQRSPAYSRLEQLIERDQCVILDGGIATELGELDDPRLRAARRGALGHLGAAQRAALGHARAPRLRRGRLQRHLHQYVGHPGGDERRARPGGSAAGRLDGARAARHPARAPGHRRGGPLERLRGGLQPPRRRGRRAGARAARAAHPRVRGRAARPDAARDDVADPRHRPSTRWRRCGRGLPGVAQLPPLPPRRSAASSASTGAAPRATCSGARRGASRRWAWARSSSTASRRTTWRGCSRGCATSPTCRSACTRTSATTPSRAGPPTDAIGGAEYAELAAELARGGRPDHRRLLRRSARTTSRRRGSSSRTPARARGARSATRSSGPRAVDLSPAAGPWSDEHERSLYPLPMPRIMVEPGRVRAHARQLPRLEAPVREPHRRGQALSRRGLRHRPPHHPARAQRRRPTCTPSTSTSAPWPTRSATPSATAVADRVSGEQVDLYPWDPDERYEVVVASLYQMPNDPFEQLSSHRPLDYWGRSLLDHLLSLLPSLLEAGRPRLRDAALDPEPGGDAARARAQRAALARRGLRLLRVQPAVPRSTRSRSTAWRSSRTPTT